MKIIVSTKYFAEFLNVQINNCTQYFIHVNDIHNKFHIRSDQDDPELHGEYIWVDNIKDAEDIELTGDQLRKLKQFLKSIPHQPIVIEFENESIKCTDFIVIF